MSNRSNPVVSPLDYPSFKEDQTCRISMHGEADPPILYRPSPLRTHSLDAGVAARSTLLRRRDAINHTDSESNLSSMDPDQEPGLPTPLSPSWLGLSTGQASTWNPVLSQRDEQTGLPDLPPDSNPVSDGEAMTPSSSVTKDGPASAETATNSCRGTQPVGDTKSSEITNFVSGRRWTGKRSREAAIVHNSSEKRRRERLSTKIKLLQELVPNSTKTDKVSILDDAINYLIQLKSDKETTGSVHNLPNPASPCQTKRPNSLLQGTQREFGIQAAGLYAMQSMAPSVHKLPSCVFPVYSSQLMMPTVCTPMPDQYMALLSAQPQIGMTAFNNYATDR